MALDGTEIVRSERDVVQVTGEDAVAYLQSQLSQDVASMVVGQTARSFVLAPTGHVVGWFRIQRIGPNEFLLDTDAGAGAGEAIITRLTRFRLRMDVSFSLETRVRIQIRGAEAEAAAERLAAEAAGSPLRSRSDWPSDQAFEILLATDDDPGVGIDRGCFEYRRIAAGVPRAGFDFAVDGSTIPAELGPWAIRSAVDFTKGCYTGQELVARVDSRGNNVPRPLRLLRVPVVPAIGALVSLGDDEVGRVTSAALGPDGSAVAMATVARRVEVGTEVSIAWTDASATALAEALPV